MKRQDGGSTSFYLVRHAHADWRPGEMRPLSEQDRADSRRLDEALDGAGIQAIYSSPYRRAWQTVEPLAERLAQDIQPAPALRERSLGKIDRTWTPCFEEAVHATWRDFQFTHPGGESNAEAQARAVSLQERLGERHRGGSIVLSTHGNLLALLLNHHDPSLAFEFWRSLSMPDVYRLKVNAKGSVKIHRLWVPRGRDRSNQKHRRIEYYSRSRNE